MSTWKRTALEMLPDCTDIITKHGLKATALWAELRTVCEAAHKRGDDDLLKRIYDYAKWCWQSNAEHLQQAVSFAFYQHVPIIPSMRQDIHRWFSVAQYQELREPFSRQLSDSELAELEREFRESDQSIP